MPTIYVPTPTHSCLRDCAFEPDLNKDDSRRVVGEIWECAECGQRWTWDGDGNATVPHPYWARISERASNRVLKQARRNKRLSQ